ncbi:hypothetical protein H5410_038997 [Solanum commersonii]|uniref:Uncharacterized protein n=1 Tax=Solanum commersonii TaxID=4109 RepID=A0A9J5YCC1_SOLCO|nr:hypothetical protein H5410_038997 [Solanum commersonii]
MAHVELRDLEGGMQPLRLGQTIDYHFPYFQGLSTSTKSTFQINRNKLNILTTHGRVPPAHSRRGRVVPVFHPRPYYTSDGILWGRMSRSP